MFRCDKCNEVSESCVPPVRKVVSKKTRQYNDGYKVGIGWEILKEMNLCPSCDKIIPEAEVPILEKIENLEPRLKRKEDRYARKTESYEEY